MALLCRRSTNDRSENNVWGGASGFMQARALHLAGAKKAAASWLVLEQRQADIEISSFVPSEHAAGSVSRYKRLDCEGPREMGQDEIQRVGTIISKKIHMAL